MRIKHFYIITIIVIVFCISVLNSNALFGQTFSKYKAYTSANTSIEIAVPIIEDNVTSFDVPLDEIAPGVDHEYNFYVTNINSISQINEVTMNYTIEVLNSGYLPIEIELEKDGIETNVLTNNKTPIYELSHSNVVRHNYKLIIKWNISYSEYTYANLVEVLTVKIEAIQKVN